MVLPAPYPYHFLLQRLKDCKICNSILIVYIQRLTFRFLGTLQDLLNNAGAVVLVGRPLEHIE